MNSTLGLEPVGNCSVDFGLASPYNFVTQFLKINLSLLVGYGVMLPEPVEVLHRTRQRITERTNL